MKYLWILLACASTVILGCATIPSGGLPKQRPDDFVVTYSNGGGMLNQSEYYYICRDSAVRDSRFQGNQKRWSCKPDVKLLDALYAQFLKDDITSIKPISEGEVYDRGGITLHFSYGAKNFEIMDAGSYFVTDKDQIPFDRAADGIVNLVDNCLQSQAIPVEIDLQLAIGDSVPQVCELRLDENLVIEWKAGNAKPLAGPHSFKLLPGKYEIQGSAQVGTKWVSLNMPIKVSTDQHNFHLLLKNDSFTFLDR